MVKDVLIKVKEFVFLVDFVMLETEMVVGPEMKYKWFLINLSLSHQMHSLIKGMKKRS